jgi:hypothetical protein
VTLDLIPSFIREHFEVHEWRHAVAILANDFPSEWHDIVGFLQAFRLYETDFTIPGGNRSKVAQVVDAELKARGWVEKGFDTRMLVDGVELTNPTHKIDCYKNRIALEVEWNNKDPFYDRDLNNFRILFDLRTISIGIILTRCDDLQSIANRLGRGSSCQRPPHECGSVPLRRMTVPRSSTVRTHDARGGLPGAPVDCGPQTLRTTRTDGKRHHGVPAPGGRPPPGLSVHGRRPYALLQRGRLRYPSPAPAARHGGGLPGGSIPLSPVLTPETAHCLSPRGVAPPAPPACKRESPAEVFYGVSPIRLISSGSKGAKTAAPMEGE